MRINLKAISSLEKAYKRAGKQTFKELKHISGLKGETVSFQLNFCPDHDRLLRGMVSLYCDDPVMGKAVRLRQVNKVPVVRPWDPSGDEYYLETEPCVLPDLLTEISEDGFPMVPHLNGSFWVDVDIPRRPIRGVTSLPSRFPAVLRVKVPKKRLK